MEDVIYDVCVIGAGIVGSCAAYNAIKCTKSVVLCDQVCKTRKESHFIFGTSTVEGGLRGAQPPPKIVGTLWGAKSPVTESFPTFFNKQRNDILSYLVSYFKYP